jgi:hypothetical protein
VAGFLFQEMLYYLYVGTRKLEARGLVGVECDLTPCLWFGCLFLPFPQHFKMTETKKKRHLEKEKQKKKSKLLY